MKAFGKWACIFFRGWPVVVTAATPVEGTSRSPTAVRSSSDAGAPQSAAAARSNANGDTPSTTPAAPDVPLRAELSGAPSCNSGDYFLGEIFRRTPRARRATGGEVGWTLRVTVEPQGSRFDAKLTILANEGNWIERELMAPTCNDALEALAVVVSVLVETAVEQIEADRTNHIGSSTDEAAAENASKSVPLPYVAGGVWVPWLDEPNYFERRGVTPIPARYVRAMTASVDLDGQVVSKPVVGLGIGFEISRWHPNLFNPSYGLSLGWIAGDMSANVVSTPVQTDVSRLNLRADLCPVELLRRRNIGLRPCARSDFGIIYVHYDVPPAPYGHRYRHTERYRQFRTSPFLRLSYSPIAGAEVRADLGVDFRALPPRIPFGTRKKRNARTPLSPISDLCALGPESDGRLVGHLTQCSDCRIRRRN
ncbi:MAG: hypothetical protein QM784_16425 [Polyangiaceae bacterium]